MQLSITTAMLGALLGQVALCAAMAYLCFLPRAPEAQRWWLGAFVLMALQGGFLLLREVKGELLLGVEAEACQAAAAILLLAGTVQFLHRRAKPLRVAAGGALLVGWVVLGLVYAPSESWRRLVQVDVLTGLVLAFTGWAFWRGRAGPYRLEYGALALGFALWGLHNLSSPLLAYLGDYSAAWYLVAEVLSLWAAGGLIITSLRRQRGLAEEAAQRAAESERSLRASERRFRAFVESASDIVWEMDADERFTFVSERFEALSGYPLADMVGKNRKDVPFLRIDRAGREELREAYLRGRPYRNVDLLLHTASGQVRVLRTTGAPFHDEQGRLLGFRGTGNDVTAEVAAQEEARAAQGRLAGGIESIAEGMLLFDPADRLVLCNSKVRHWFEAVEHRLTPGTPMRELVAAAARQGLVPGAAGNEEHWLSRNGDRFHHRHGVSELHLRGGLTLVLDARATQDGGTVCVLTDTTATLAREQRLRQSQKLEAIGQLTGGVAHEFNNLLQVMAGFTELALTGLEAGDRRRADLERVSEAISKAGGLTQKLMAFSRQQVLQPERVDLAGLLRDFASRARERLEPSVRVVVDASEGVRAVRADPALLESVLLDLSDNAREAMPGGGTITLSASHTDPAGGPLAAGFARLTVADTGRGIPAEALERLFDPFFKVDDRVGAPGLGLAMVYGIVRQHRGVITVDSVLGKGSRFHILLPLDEAAAADPARRTRKTPSAASPAGQPTLLLAEDDAMVRELATRVLQTGGYAVEAYTDGAEAVEAFEARPDGYSLVVMDVLMPNLNGREALARIRRTRPNTPAILMSGYAGKDTEDLLGEGVHFLPKPHGPSDLLRLVKRVLDPPA